MNWSNNGWVPKLFKSRSQSNGNVMDTVPNSGGTWSAHTWNTVLLMHLIAITTTHCSCFPAVKMKAGQRVRFVMCFRALLKFHPRVKNIYIFTKASVSTNQHSAINCWDHYSSVQPHNFYQAKQQKSNSKTVSISMKMHPLPVCPWGREGAQSAQQLVAITNPKRDGTRGRKHV